MSAFHIGQFEAHIGQFDARACNRILYRYRVERRRAVVILIDTVHTCTGLSWFCQRTASRERAGARPPLFSLILILLIEWQNTVHGTKSVSYVKYIRLQTRELQKEGPYSGFVCHSSGKLFGICDLAHRRRAIQRVAARRKRATNPLSYLSLFLYYWNLLAPQPVSRSAGSATQIRHRTSVSTLESRAARLRGFLVFLPSTVHTSCRESSKAR